MKPLSTVFGIVLVLAFLAPSAAAHTEGGRPEGIADGSTSAADAILGSWASPEGESVVEVTKTEQGYIGVVVRAKAAALVGKQLFRNLKYDAARGTWGGDVFAPKRDEFLTATFAANADGSLTMTAGKGLFSKTIRWTRP
jgi:uncharacterized protein (DUF2147 family)